MRRGGREIAFREYPLEAVPGGGEVAIAIRQRPEAMQVIGQQADCVQLEWLMGTSSVQCRAQACACERCGQNRAAVEGDQCEEVRSAGDAGTRVIRHGPSRRFRNGGAGAPPSLTPRTGPKYLNSGGGP